MNAFNYFILHAIAEPLFGLWLLSCMLMFAYILFMLVRTEIIMQETAKMRREYLEGKL